MNNTEQVRPEQRFLEAGFLLNPRPEQVYKINGFPGEVLATLTVGLKTITDNGAGQKIIPTVHVVIALGDTEIDLDPSMLSDMLPRFQKMCDVALAVNKVKSG